jgi:hypothetical protein
LHVIGAGTSRKREGPDEKRAADELSLVPGVLDSAGFTEPGFEERFRRLFPVWTVGIIETVGYFTDGTSSELARGGDEDWHNLLLKCHYGSGIYFVVAAEQDTNEPFDFDLFVEKLPDFA